MKKVVLVHALPLEYYPPACNMIDYISNNELRLQVHTYGNNKNLTEYQNAKCRIFRTAFPETGNGSISRLFKYFTFNLRTLIRLVRYKPDSILYYEPHSAWPVYWYYKLLKTNTKLYIHYHEYYPPEHYLDKGMRLVKLNHKYEEKCLFKKAEWISHTNMDRVQLFLKDHPNIDQHKVKVMPNYPPEAWQEKVRRSLQTLELDALSDKDTQIKMVYVGSLSFKDTYIKEVCDWVIRQKGKVYFDIYSFNIHSEAKEYLLQISGEYICYFGKGVDYQSLPEILVKYDVGLILYKCNTLNYVYNATNKLFEYLVCGLDVWFPIEMKGAYEYIENNEAPFVNKIDFKNLNEVEYKSLISIKNGRKTRKYAHEDALRELVVEMKKNSIN